MPNLWADLSKQLKANNKLSVVAVLILSDFICILLSAITAFQFRFPQSSLDTDSNPAIAQFDYRGILVLIVLSWLFLFILTGIYRFKHSNLFVLNLQLVIKRSVYFFFFLGFISFILKASFSRIVFGVMLVSGLVYLILGRLITYFLILKPLILKKKVISKMMIVGRSAKDLKDHSEWIIENRTLGYSVVSRVICNQISSEWIEEFDHILRYKKIDEVLLLPGMESDKNFSKFIHYCEDLEININWIPLDSGSLGYWLIPTSQEGIPFLTFEKSAISIPWRIIKRTFDLLFATVFFLIFSPVLLLIAFLVLISSGYPVLYSQTRVGLNGKTFRFYKFRSMIKDADQRLLEVENIHKRDHVIFKNKEDPRITPIGRILRKYSLDELPQFFNVINGSMSVVGPRPALTREVSLYNSTYERRLNAKPGITGPWQISGRSDLDLQTSISLDLNYLTNWSFTRDLWIIIATVGAVFKGKGAY
jgi:exopolysaccharide biosynthesis polyprenyl glycosylphosphotransferase